MRLLIYFSVDINAYIVWRLSGFPKNRVFGMGTLLDSSKFRIAISRKLSINPKSVNGFVLGEQGPKSGNKIFIVIAQFPFGVPLNALVLSYAAQMATSVLQKIKRVTI